MSSDFLFGTLRRKPPEKGPPPCDGTVVQTQRKGRLQAAEERDLWAQACSGGDGCPARPVGTGLQRGLGAGRACGWTRTLRGWQGQAPEQQVLAPPKATRDPRHTRVVGWGPPSRGQR